MYLIELQKYINTMFICKMQYFFKELTKKRIILVETLSHNEFIIEYDLIDSIENILQISVNDKIFLVKDVDDNIICCLIEIISINPLDYFTHDKLSNILNEAVDLTLFYEGLRFHNILESKIALKDKEFLFLLFDIPDTRIINILLENIKGIFMVFGMGNELQKNDFHLIDLNLFEMFINKFLVAKLKLKQRKFIKSHIDHLFQVYFKGYTESEIHSNKFNLNETLRFIDCFEQNMLPLSENTIEKFLDAKNVYDYSIISLLLCHKFPDTTRQVYFKYYLSLLKQLECIFSSNLKINQEETYANIFHVILFVFDSNCTLEMVDSLLRSIATIILPPNEPIFNPKRNYKHIKPINRRVLDILMFLHANHSIFFNEFFINTGLLKFFKLKQLNAQEIFFWDFYTRRNISDVDKMWGKYK